MKKVLLIAISIIFLGAGAVQAQNSFIGGRFGSGTSVSGAELSYLMEFSAKKQLELDLGLGIHAYDEWDSYWGWTPRIGIGVSLVGSYQWKFPIGNIDGFNWYIGPAAGVRFYTGNTNFFVGAGAQAGVSYEFKFPLQVGFDVRSLPIGYNSSYDYFFDMDFGAIVRYRIGG